MEALGSPELIAMGRATAVSAGTCLVLRCRLGGRQQPRTSTTGIARTISCPCTCQGDRFVFLFTGQFWGLSQAPGAAGTQGTHPCTQGAPVVLCWPGSWLEHADKTHNGVMNLALGMAIWKLPSVLIYVLMYGGNASNNKVINLE